MKLSKPEYPLFLTLTKKPTIFMISEKVVMQPTAAHAVFLFVPTEATQAI